MSKIILSSKTGTRKSQLIEILNKYINLPTDLEIYSAANNDLASPVSVRTWKRWKHRYGWDFKKQTELEGISSEPIRKTRTRKKKYLKAKKDTEVRKWLVGENPIDFSIPDLVIKRSVISEYTSLDKALIIDKICESYETGLFNLHQLCRSQQIDYGTFIRWVNSDEIFIEKFRISKARHWEVFFDLFLDSWKQFALNNLLRGKETVETIRYEFHPILDNATEKLKWDKIPTHSTEVTRPVKPDVELVKMFVETVKDIKARQNEIERLPTTDVSFSNDPLELLKYAQEMLKDYSNIDE